jgi:3-hydroxyisobutyrate dehydrogenase-like beta-hydroxyacid dehydrogenase
MVKEQISDIVEKTRAAFVDVAMMGAVPIFLHRVPMLASGNGATLFKERMEPFEMRVTCIGDRPGQASAIKMFRSIFMKGLFALLLETLNATHRYNVDDAVLQSIAETMEKNSFLETVRLVVTRGVIHAERRAHEMEEVIKTLEGIDVPPTMSEATKEKLYWCTNLGLKEYFGGETPQSLSEVLNAIDEKLAP